MVARRATLRHVALEFGLAAEDLEGWVDRHWIRPLNSQGEFVFDDADRARVRMIVDFHHDLAIDDEAMPVVLDLVDRLHAARAVLRSALQCVAELPEASQSSILHRIKGEAEK